MLSNVELQQTQLNSLDYIIYLQGYVKQVHQHITLVHQHIMLVMLVHQHEMSHLHMFRLLFTY